MFSLLLLFSFTIIKIKTITGYTIGPNKLTWDAAKTYCESQGSTLASVHNKAELDEVSALCDTYPSGDGECHLGMKLDTSDSKWKWIDGTPSDYGFNMYNGAPVYSKPPWEAEYAYDGCHANTCTTQDALCFIVDESNGDGYFCDSKCSFEKPPICNSAASDSNCDYNYAFVTDESGSVGKTHYEMSIDFLIDLVANHIDASAKLMALAFSSSSHQQYIHRFTQTQNPRDAIINALITEKGDYNGGQTYTKAALEIVLAEFVANGYTSNNILILVTDGYPHDGPCDNMVLRDALVAQDVRVVIIGVGLSGFNTAPVECLVNGNTDDIIVIDSFDFSPVIPQLEQGQIVCTSCLVSGTPSVCYDIDQNSPCDPLIQPNVYYYPSCSGYCHYIQCDAHGNVWDRPTAPGTIWDQSILGQIHPPAAKTMSALNDIHDIKVKNVENKSNYYGHIMLIGVIAFILINNIFIGCWCLGKGRNKAHAKFDMISNEI